MTSKHVPLLTRALSTTPVIYLYESCLILGIWMILHHHLWQGNLYLGWDAVRESWGDIQYAAMALQQGYIPWWNHLERAGYPFLADPQTAFFYPPSWILYLGISIFGAGLWIPLARTLLHYMIAVIGIRVLGKSWGYSRWISLAASLCFILSGRLAKAKDSAGLWTMVWLPWMIWSMQKWVKKPNLHHAIIVALVMTLAFYAGYPPNLYRAALLSFAFTLYQGVMHYRILAINERLPYIKACLYYLIISLLIFAILTAPGIIATLDQLPNTVRTQLSTREILSSRFVFFEVLDLFIPRLIHTKSYAMLYVGILPSLAACYALVHAVIHKRRQELFWCLSFITFTLLACGGNAFLLPFLVKYIPTFNLWRIAEQYLFVSVFVWIILAMRGTHLFLSNSMIAEDKNRHLTGSITQKMSYLLILLGSSICIALIYRYSTQSWSTVTLRLLYSMMTFLFIGGVLYYARILKRKYLVLLLLGVQLVDVYLQHAPIYQILQRKPILTRDRLLPKDLSIGQRIADDQFFRWRVASRSGIPDFLGRYSTMVGAKYQSFRKMAEKKPILWSHAGINIYAGRHAHKQAQQFVKNLKQGKQNLQKFKKRSAYHYQLPSSPYMYWTEQVYHLPSDLHILKALASTDRQELAFISKPYLFSRAYSTFKPQKNDQQNSHTSTKIKILTNAWGYIKASLATQKPGMLIVREAYHKHWKVQLRNQDTGQILYPESIPSNYLFQGIYIPTGRWDVILKYEHTLLRYALCCMIFTIIIILCYFTRKIISYKNLRSRYEPSKYLQ